MIQRLFAQLLLVAAAPFAAYAQWTPSGPLRAVPVIVDCSVTGGDIAVVRQGAIYHCPEAAVALNAIDPDVGHFYYVHEFGHITGRLQETDADCWAGQQLAGAPNGRHYLDSAIRHFRRRGSES